jgi:hypothetical protein
MLIPSEWEICTKKQKSVKYNSEMINHVLHLCFSLEDSKGAWKETAINLLGGVSP